MPITYQILHWVLCISCVSPHTHNLPLPWSPLLCVCAHPCWWLSVCLGDQMCTFCQYLFHLSKLLFLTYQKLCMINVYNLVSLEIKVYTWNDYHNPCHKPIYHFRKLPPSFTITIIIIIIIIL